MIRAVSGVPTSIPSIVRRIITDARVLGSTCGTPVAANPPTDTSIKVQGTPLISISAGSLARRERRRLRGNDGRPARSDVGARPGAPAVTGDFCIGSAGRRAAGVGLVGSCGGVMPGAPCATGGFCTDSVGRRAGGGGLVGSCSGGVKPGAPRATGGFGTGSVGCRTDGIG